MNAKYALALILALQVSLSLCEIPAPSDELVKKYEDYEKTFLMRILTAFKKIQKVVTPVVESIGQTEVAQMAKEYREGLQVSPQVKTLENVYEQVSIETAQMAQNARMQALGLYEHYVREYVGEYLSDAIDKAKVYLNMYFPAEPMHDHSA